MKIADMLQRRAKLIADARALLDRAETEQRELTAEEQQAFDALHADAGKLWQQAQREQEQQRLERGLSEAIDRVVEPENERTSSRPSGPTATPEYRDAFRAMLGGRPTPEQRAVLQVDSDIGGGFIVASEQFVNTLLQAVDSLLPVGGMVRSFGVNYEESLGVPTLTGDVDEFSWEAGELTEAEEDTGLSFGKRELKPRALKRKIVKISRRLLESPRMDAEALVISRVSYALAKTKEKALLLGSGAGQPLGLFVASDDGIPTSRDVSTDNTATALTFEGLIEAKYAVKPAYWPNSVWLFHPDAVKKLSKLKDLEGQYVWRQGVREGESVDTLLGRPVVMSDFVPNTFTKSLYVGLFGDFSYYWVANAISLSIQRLVEMYASTGQVGLLFDRMACDGMPVLSEAFARVQLAAS